MILITSRCDYVEHYTRPSSPRYQLPPLDAEKSWELFCRKVFGNEECPHHLKLIGKSIVERCGGIPLAIITIAGLVSKKERSNKEWSQIKDFVPWYLEDSTKVMDVLKVSYDNLPEILKPCFLYFGVFPKDYEIVARNLIQLWMAEGFIQPEKTRKSKVLRPEDIGDKYLNELVERNLVQVVERRADGGVKTCRIHDLFRQLCISESEVNNFLKVCTESTEQTLGNFHRLSLLCDPRPRCRCLDKDDNQPSTRSLFFFARMSYPDNIMENFQELYVLHLARHVLFEKVPFDLIMFHLKYLRIEGFNCAEGMPDWIWNLYKLETLDLRGCVSSKICICIWKLERLRHIFTKEPVKLEVYEEAANSKPIMWNLQTLTKVDFTPEIMLLINNGCFPNLLKLGLSYGLRIISEEYLQHEPLLWNLHHLSNLRVLKIDFCFGRFSSFDKIVFPPNISKITLRRIVKVDESGCMSSLGRIPSLRILKLDDGLSGETLNCGAARDFPQLKVFRIKRFSELRRLTSDDGAMPYLQHMVIQYCDELKEIPERLLPLCEIK